MKRGPAKYLRDGVSRFYGQNSENVDLNFHFNFDTLTVISGGKGSDLELSCGV